MMKFQNTVFLFLLILSSTLFAQEKSVAKKYCTPLKIGKYSKLLLRDTAINDTIYFSNKVSFSGENKYRYYVPGIVRAYSEKDSTKTYTKKNVDFDNYYNAEEFYSSGFNKENNYNTASFYIDKNYVSNKEYRAFVNYTRDSVYHTKLYEVDDKHMKLSGEYGEQIVWKTPISFKDSLAKNVLKEIYKQSFSYDTLFERHAIKPDSLIYTYWWIDWTFKETTDRCQWIKKIELPIYPDTLIWLNDTSIHLPMEQKIFLSKYYFSDPQFDNEAVVGVNKEQMKAYLEWATRMMNNYTNQKGKPINNNLRFPIDAELFSLRAFPPQGIILYNKKEIAIEIKAKDYAQFLMWCKRKGIQNTAFVNNNDSLMKVFNLNEKTTILPAGSSDIEKAILTLKTKKNDIKSLLNYDQAFAFLYWLTIDVPENKNISYCKRMITKQDWEKGFYPIYEYDINFPGKVFRAAQSPY